MSLWLIEPRDPLIFRDGRPFGNTPGARAQSLPFPFPSTIAGGMRTNAGTDPASGRFDKTKIDQLLTYYIRGPLLITLNRDGGIREWYLPAPNDVLLLKADTDSRGKRLRLQPLQMDSHIVSDLDNFHLAVVGPTADVPEKPHTKPPPFWKWAAYSEWLLAPRSDVQVGDLADFGQVGLVREFRTHVSIDPRLQAASEGALFQTSGLEFVHTGSGREQPVLSRIEQLALAVETDAPLREGLAFMGGERRVIRWDKAQINLPDCPPDVRQKIVKQRHCRLLLATPGCFEQGFLPTWVLTSTAGVTATVKAAAVQRYQTVSGWDYALGNPKPTKRLTPAGSVYFLALDGDDDAINNFITDVWMRNISDDSQDRLDGFGLALLGTWNGDLAEMERAI